MKLKSVKAKVWETPETGRSSGFIYVYHNVRTPVARRCSQVLFGIQRIVLRET